MYEYSHMPEFDKLITKYGIEETKSLLGTIEHMRYMTYVISYLANNCCEITEPSSNYENTYNTLSKTFMKSATDASSVNLKKAVKKLHKVILHDTHSLFIKMYNRFCDVQTDYKDIDKNEAFTEIVTTRWFEWSIIGGRKFYNEIENPTFIHFLLEKIFTHTPDTVVNNSVYVYDWGDFDVSFKDEESMEHFIENFVETGVAFERDKETGVWSEMYSF